MGSETGHRQEDGEAAPSRSLGQRAFRTLEAEIVRCNLWPGEAVSESALARRYGFGKAPIRHALSRLRQAGYVLSIPRRGHVIAPVTLASARELFELRALLEPAAVERACGRVDRAALRALDAECARDYRPGDRESERRFIDANMRFHMTLVEAGGNARLAASVRQILREMMRLLHLGFVTGDRPPMLGTEHAGLIDAVVDNRPDEARHICLTHIRSVEAMVLEGIARHHATR